MATVELTADNFENAIEQEGILLIDFWAPWCGPCRTFGPVYEKLSDSPDYEDMTFAKVNTEDEQQLAAALQIRAIPTLMVLRDGVLLYRESGALPEPALESLVQQVRDLDMDEVRARIAEQNRDDPAEA